MKLKSCPPCLNGKKHRCTFLLRNSVLRHTLVIVLYSFNVTASVLAQQITLDVKEVPLTSVFKLIKKQSGYDFVYRDEYLTGTHSITLKVTNASLEEVLKRCFERQPISCEIVGKTVVVKRKSEPENPPAKQMIKDADKSITGIVTDTAGNRIAGVGVKVKGTNISTVTNASGNFRLAIPENAILVFSFVGYKNKEVGTSIEISFNIVLHRSDSRLDEVKVIGYGTTTQRLSTGSVSRVSAAEIERQPVSNPIAALQGRVPGLFITQVNGLPGSGFSIKIRGRNSITQGTEPLYIIDGIPYDGNNPTQLVATGQLNVNNPFNSINPGDIESIEVLKDADATSIYGSRGANGVILITTKRGKAGSLSLSLDAYTGWSKVGRSLHLMNPEQFRALRREAFANDGITPDASNAPDLMVFDTTINTNFSKILIGGTARTSNLQFRLSGGNQNTQFTAGANYNYQSTVFPGDNSAGRKSLNLSVSHTSTDKRFSALFTSSYSYNRSNLLPTDLTSSLAYPPYGFKLRDDKGNLVWSDAALYYGNPLSATVQQYNSLSDVINTSGVISYKVFPGLMVKANGGYNLLNYDERVLTPLATFDPSYNINGSAAFAHNTVRNWSIEPQIEYSGTFRKYGKITGLLGGSWQASEGNTNFISGSGYTSDALINSISGAARVTARNDYNLYHYNALFGRVSLNWDSRYLLNITARRDGSSRFGPGNQFANFGSVGGAWIFSESSLIKNQISALSFGKLRMSYGTSGNDQIGNYQYLDNYSALANLYQQALSLQPVRLFNKNYSWEQSKKIEAALELGFFSDRIYLSTAYFRSRSDNQLINFTLPAQTGFTSIMINFPGKVQNTGWEFELRSDIIKAKQLVWSTAFNITIARNKLLAFPELASYGGANTYAIGQPLSVLFGYTFQGVDPQTGNYKVLDKNGDGIYDQADYGIIGNTDPKFYGGFQNSIRYRSFTFDFLFQFVKQKGRDPIYSQSSPLGSGTNLPTYVAEHWKKPGDVVPYAKVTQAYGSELYDSYNLVSYSSAMLTDASYIRLKNASLTYKLSERWAKALSLKSLSVYTEGQNLLTITPYKGPDPESQSIYILPPLRTIAFGIKAIL